MAEQELKDLLVRVGADFARSVHESGLPEVVKHAAASITQDAHDEMREAARRIRCWEA